MFELFGENYEFDEIYSIEAFDNQGESLEVQYIGDYEETEGLYLDAAYYEITMDNDDLVAFTLDIWVASGNDEDMLYDLFQPT